MIVSHKHKFLFIRPRKVAGTSVSIALGDCLGSRDVQVFLYAELRPVAGVDGDDFPLIREKNADSLDFHNAHALPRTLRDALGEDVWRSYCKFTIVRNPWDLVVSLHVDWMRRLWDDFQTQGLYGRVRSSNFFPRSRAFREAQRLWRSGRHKESLELALRRGLYSMQLEAMEQFYFLDGHRYADCYLRFENLQEDYDDLCQRLGIAQRLLPKAKTELRKGEGAKGRGQYQHYYTNFSRQRIADCCGRMLDEFGYSFD